MLIKGPSQGPVGFAIEVENVILHPSAEMWEQAHPPTELCGLLVYYGDIRQFICIRGFNSP